MCRDTPCKLEHPQRVAGHQLSLQHTFGPKTCGNLKFSVCSLSPLPTPAHSPPAIHCPSLAYKVNSFSSSRRSLLNVEQAGPGDAQLIAAQADGDQRTNTWSQQDRVYAASYQCFLPPPWSLQKLPWALSRDRCVPLFPLHPFPD